MRYTFTAKMAFLLACFVPLAASATSITYVGTTTVPGGGVAPGSATNYDFFGGNQPASLAGYDLTIAVAGEYPGNGNYTTVTAPGGSTPFTTGIAYDSGHGQGAYTSVIATFSPKAGGSFNVYILDGDTDANGVGNSSVGLSVNGGAAVTAASVLGGSNTFIEYTVSGASASDVFSLSATTSSNHTGYTSLGGVTFSNENSSTPSAVPEPSALVLCGTGMLSAAGAVRRRLKA